MLLPVPPPKISPWWRRIALVLGVLVILVGTADVFTRAAAFVSTTDISFDAFAPGALIVNPELWGEIHGTSTAAFVPATLIIPAIGVEAPVEQVGKKADGSMDTPKKLSDVAWYEPGQKPGEPGNAVFAGHVNNALGLAGVFKELSKLKEGDRIEVEGAGGERLVYEIESVSEYFLDNAPISDIFTNRGPSKIALITCQGSWDASTRTYDKRLVVVAHLLNP